MTARPFLLLAGFSLLCGIIAGRYWEAGRELLLALVTP